MSNSIIDRLGDIIEIAQYGETRVLARILQEYINLPQEEKRQIGFDTNKKAPKG